MNYISISAKEWFDKANGNSYFAARIMVDDKHIGTLPFQYGYGDHYIDMANQWLDLNGYLYNPRSNKGVPRERAPLWRYCEDNGIKLFTFKQDRCLKRELKEWEQ